MQASQLAAIIKRLVAMQSDDNSEITERRFEKSGDLIAEVSYDQDKEAFTMTDIKAKQTFEFDNIDLVAIELYDLLAD